MENCFKRKCHCFKRKCRALLSLDVLNISSVFQAYPVIMGEIDPSGNLSANMIYSLTKELKCKAVAQVRNISVIVAKIKLFWL